MNQVIQTIIPAPADMWTIEDGQPRRIVCLALIVDEYNLQSVIPMAMDSAGEIRPAHGDIVDPAADSIN